MTPETLKEGKALLEAYEQGPKQPVYAEDFDQAIGNEMALIDWLWNNREALIAAVAGWRPIETAPKDGTEILGWRDDSGPLMIRWTCLDGFLSERELQNYSEDEALEMGWFYADFLQGGRLDEAPTRWMPLPPTPTKE